MYFVFIFIQDFHLFQGCEISFVQTMDGQQNAVNEGNQVLAVFDGLLPMVWPLFFVMILYSCTVFSLY